MRRRSSVTAKNLFGALLRAAGILLFAAAPARAETLPFKNYTTADGLGHDRVEEIVRDSRGFLWFCTGEGLARFDGYEFKNFSQADGLPHRRIMDLIETRDGKYLVATYAGVAVFNPQGVSRRWNDVEARQEAPPDSSEPPMFRVLRPPDAKQDKKSWTVYDLHETRDGRIWVATLGGFYRLEQAGDEWTFHRVRAEVWGDKAIEFLQLHEDRAGALWIASGSGLFRQMPDGRIDVLHQINGGLSMMEDRQGQIWLGGGYGTPGLAVVGFDGEQEKPVVRHNYTMKDGLTANDWIYDLFETSDGRILVAIANGLCEYLPNAKENEPKFRVVLPGTVESVSLAEDSGGNIWVGTGSKGALKITRGGFTLFDETDFPKPKPFAFNSIFAGEGSQVFLSEHSYDLIRFDGAKFTAVKPAEMTGRSWGWNQIDFRSRTGEWWIGSGDKVLRYPNAAFEDLPRTKPIGVYSFTPPGMSRKNVFFRLFEDLRGDVWMSMLPGNADDKSGISLLRWERATDQLQAYVPGEHGIPSDNGPTAFAEDRAGNLWIGFYFGGLVRYRDGKFQMFESKDGMPTGIVNAIYCDRGGRIWIATGSNGIVRVDEPADETPRMVNLTVAEGLSSNQAACLTEDNFGRIYIGTGRGVTRIEPETGRIKIYSQADGLPFSYVRTCGRDGAGTLWFTQTKILARLVPELDETSAPPPVFIGSVRVNGESARKLSELGETAVANLEFTDEQRQVQIGYFALGFGTGETLRYQYKLNNADWSEPSGQRTVNLNLASGSYNFEVRAVNAEGVTSERPARVAFSIAYPLYRRLWFMLLAALAISLIVYAIYRYRINQIIKLERVRTRLATDLHDDIGSSLSKIAILSEVVRKKNGADSDGGSFEPLEIIANTSREMVDSMSDIVWAINPERDHLSDLVQRMRHFTEEMLDAAGIEYEFSSAENLKDITLGADLRREIYLIFKECVNNLAKHSEATCGRFEIRLEKDFLIIEIEDDGRGFAVETLPAETSSAYAADIGETAGARSFGGNGLRNMRRRAENLGGEFEIDSEPGNGTRIALKVPVS